jgi:hypothetical protein
VSGKDIEYSHLMVTSDCRRNELLNVVNNYIILTNFMVLVRERIIPTEQPPIVGMVSAAELLLPLSLLSRSDFIRTHALSTSLDHSHVVFHCKVQSTHKVLH